MAHPGLKHDDQGVSGSIAFTADYDQKTNTFKILDSATDNKTGNGVLSGQFVLRIQKREKFLNSELPAVYIEGIEHTKDRHFDQSDGSACLCSPLDEAEFLQPQFEFKKFIEILVIPFLYGQIFYSREQEWPWGEWSHGNIGVLESYQSSAERKAVEKCLMFLHRDKYLWHRVLKALQQKTHPNGNMQCFCGRKVRIKMCHKLALAGAIRLRKDVKEFGVMFH